MIGSLIWCFFFFEAMQADEWSGIEAGGSAAVCLVFFFAAMVKFTGSSGYLSLFFTTIGIGLVSLSGLIIWNYSIPNGWAVWEARHWPAVPCTILSSSVVSQKSSDSRIYFPDIRYRYKTWEGEHESNCTDRFWVTSQPGADKIVKSNPPGHETVCFVNPVNPEESCLQQGFQAMHAVLFMPLVITAMGMVFFAVAFRTRHY